MPGPVWKAATRTARSAAEGLLLPPPMVASFRLKVKEAGRGRGRGWIVAPEVPSNPDQRGVEEVWRGVDVWPLTDAACVLGRGAAPVDSRTATPRLACSARMSGCACQALGHGHGRGAWAHGHGCWTLRPRTASGHHRAAWLGRHVQPAESHAAMGLPTPYTGQQAQAGEGASGMR